MGTPAHPTNEPGSIAAQVTVACQDLTGAPSTHRVLIHADGTVTTPDHDGAEWALDGAVYQALGGPVDMNPCQYWQHPDTYRTQDNTWINGRYLPNPHQPVTLTPTDWTFADHPIWTEEAKQTALIGIGVNPESTVNILLPFTPLPDPAALLYFMQRLGTKVDGGLFARPLAEASRCVPDTDLDAWITDGIPWRTFYGFTHAGLNREQARDVCAEYTARASTYPTPASLGFPDYWATTLTDLGLPPERVAPFMVRTRMNGQFYSRTDVVAAVTALLTEEQTAAIPHEWIVEAAHMIPERHYMENTPADGGPDLPSGWSRAWSVTIGADRIAAFLTTSGDPAYWPAGWEWPTLADRLTLATSHPDTSATPNREGPTT